MTLAYGRISPKEWVAATWAFSPFMLGALANIELANCMVLAVFCLADSRERRGV